MTDSTLPADFYNGKVPPRVCGQAPGGDLDELPRHPRPAGIDLEMMAVYAVDYGIRPTQGGPLRPMDLRPLLDALAASWDRCDGCRDHHVNTVAASPALTTHAVGVALFALNIKEAPARLVLQKLDPDGAAIALTIRNSGLDAAVSLTESMGPERRRSVVGVALGVLAPTGWLDVPVSNRCPPVVKPVGSDLGDIELLADLRSDGHL